MLVLWIKGINLGKAVRSVFKIKSICRGVGIECIHGEKREKYNLQYSL